MLCPKLLKTTLLLTTAAVLQSGGAVAEKPHRQEDPSGPLVQYEQARLQLAAAELIIKSSRAKAREMNLAVNIAVVDDGGHLLGFARMDNARPASGYTAMTKATTAAMMRQATGPVPANGEPNLLLNISLQNAAADGGGKITTLKGGIPIVLNGQVVGAVGVGGATGEQDAEIAQAGVAQLLKAVESLPAE